MVSNIIKGVEYATQHADKISVANMSLGGVGNSSTLRLAVQNSVAKGIVYVAAAGNSRMNVYGTNGVFGDADDVFPACYPETMTVSAMVDTDGKAGGSGSLSAYGPDDTIASISNYSTNVVAGNPVTTPGLAIDVAAPGVSIYSTYKNHGYATMTGTSQAAGYVSGVVGVWIAEHGRATNAQGVYSIRQSLINAGEPQNQWGKVQPPAYVSSRNGYTIKVGAEPLVRAI
jgi:subtilisin family serine protease